MKRFRRSLHVVLALAILGAITSAAAPAAANPMMSNFMKRVDQMMNARNGAALGKLLAVVSAMGPDEMKEWEPIANAGAAAAARGDYVAVKKACASCHDKYRETYKAKTANYKIPGR